MRASCPIHGTLEVPAGTTICPVCWNANQTQSMLNAMEQIQETMADIDEKTNITVSDDIKNNWNLKRGNALILVPVSFIAIFFFLLPSIPIYFEISTGGSITIFILGGILSIAAFGLVTVWLFFLYKKGGILSIKEEKECQFGFNYYEDPNSRKCGGLISSVQRTRSSSLGCIRYGVCQCIFTIIFFCGLMAGLTSL